MYKFKISKEEKIYSKKGFWSFIKEYKISDDVVKEEIKIAVSRRFTKNLIDEPYRKRIRKYYFDGKFFESR